LLKRLRCAINVVDHLDKARIQAGFGALPLADHLAHGRNGTPRFASLEFRRFAFLALCRFAFSAFHLFGS